MTFPANDMLPKTVEIPIKDDTIAEDAETFALLLSGPIGASISDDTGVAKIVDNELPTYVSVGDAAVIEGSSAGALLAVNVTRSGDTNRASSVTLATQGVGGRAVAGTDYTHRSTVVDFTAGQASKTVFITVLGDTFAEADEKLHLILSLPVAAVISDATATATIVNDDALPYLSIDDISVAEGHAGSTNATFTVTRTGNTTGPASVKVSTQNATAAAGSDFIATAATVSLAADDASETVTVPVTGDLLGEASETFKLNLATPVNAVISDPTGLGTIVNDDAISYVSIHDVVVYEGNSGTTTATFTLTRTGNKDVASTVNIATADGTAIAGSDYTARTAILGFAADRRPRRSSPGRRQRRSRSRSPGTP